MHQLLVAEIFQFFVEAKFVREVVVFLFLCHNFIIGVSLSGKIG
jgi:hypothetical protein